MTDLTSLNALKAQLDTAAQAMADAASTVAAMIVAATPTNPAPNPDQGPVVTPDPGPVTNPPTPPVTTPPVVGTVNAFGPAELLSKAQGAKPGDIIVAKAGPYGDFAMKAINRGGRVTINCEDGVHFERVSFVGSKDITLRNPTAYPDKTKPFPNSAIINGDAMSTGIEVLEADVSGGIDAGDFLNWDLSKWQARKTLGIVLEGQDCRIEDAKLTALGIGAILGGARSSMKRINVRGFSIDGLRARGNGDGWLLEDIDIAYGVTISTAHPDGIQCWSVAPGGQPGSGLMSGLVIRRAYLRQWVGAASSLTATMQGVGLHDGTYDAPLIEDVTYYGSSVWGIHVGACKTPATIRNCKALHINRTTGDRPRIGAASPVSSNNVANKFTYPLGAKDQIANYSDQKNAPMMSTAA